MQRFVRCSSGSSPPCSRWPLIDSSPSLSSPPASPPASRHPAGLPRLMSFSRSGCPHPARASTASTHPSISLGFAQKCLFGTYLGRFGRGSRLLPLPAMHAHSRLAVPAFAWIRLPWSRSNLVSGHGMTQVSVHERIVSSACRMPWNQGGMGACMCVFETHQKVVCLDLLDGNAKAIKAGWTCKCIPRRIRKWFCLGLLDGNAWAIKAGWGLAYVLRRIRKWCLLDVKARAITAIKMGALACIARSMVALLHIVQSAYMGSSFSLC